MDKEFYKDILDSIYDAVYTVDRERRILYWNNAAELITGYPARKVVGSFCHDNILMHVDEKGVNLCKTKCPLARTIDDGKPRKVNVFLHHADGHRVPVTVKVKPMLDARGRIIGAVEIFSDNMVQILENEKMKELAKLAFLDPLTGVANRKYGLMKLKAMLGQTDQTASRMGAILVDVDGLNNINMLHGRKTGDRVLKTAAQTLAENVRSTDVLCRWEEGVFLVLLENCGRNILTMVASKLRSLAAQSQFREGEREVVFTISMGAALSAPGDGPESLVKRLTDLLKAGKQKGPNRLTFDEGGA